MKLFLANGLVVTRDEKIDAVAPASKPTPKAASPSEAEPASQKTFLEKAVETVEEVVKPKRRGRPKKKPAASE